MLAKYCQTSPVAGGRWPVAMESTLAAAALAPGVPLPWPQLEKNEDEEASNETFFLCNKFLSSWKASVATGHGLLFSKFRTRTGQQPCHVKLMPVFVSGFNLELLWTVGYFLSSASACSFTIRGRGLKVQNENTCWHASSSYTFSPSEVESPALCAGCIRNSCSLIPSANNATLDIADSRQTLTLSTTALATQVRDRNPCCCLAQQLLNHTTDMAKGQQAFKLIASLARPRTDLTANAT